MPDRNEELHKRLLVTFKIEAREHLQTIASGLLDLEKTSDDKTWGEILDSTFRSAHSLKGASRAVNVADIEGVCQALESVFAVLKRREIAPSPGLFDLLHQTVDVLGKLVRFIEEGPDAVPKPPVSDLIDSLQAVLTQGFTDKPRETTKTAEIAREPIFASREKGSWETPDTVRVSTARLDAVFLQVEELLSVKLATTQQTARLRQLQGRSAEWKKRWARLRSDVRSLRHSIEGGWDHQVNGISAAPQLARIVDFLEWNQDFIASQETEFMNLTATAGHDQRSVGMMVDNLLDEMKKVVMQRFSTLLDVFPPFVREISREQGKEVALEIRGGDIEIDRRILEEMKDPLIHLVRNCIGHGIETPAGRTGKGKSPRGTIMMEIFPKEGGNVELMIADDGAGIDVGKVKASAVKMGLISAEKAESLGDKEALNLICESGISTSPIITDISGRGLGLSIVKEKTEKLNGTLSIESEPGKGTVFRIVLPLTLARFRGVVVRAGEHLFVLPTVNVERMARVRKEEIKTVENRETIELGGQAMSLARLDEVLQLPRKADASGRPEMQAVAVLASANQRIAFAVDEVLNEQEVLVKPLPQQLGHVRNITGATVLGTGRVVPILNVPDLMKFAVQQGESQRAPAAFEEAGANRKKSILVAEDSITSRTLLKNILETAGYAVTTAVDGVDAFTRLKSDDFGLVVSDVDMPRMNGFGLTAKIRGDKKLHELPVVLVTALDSSKDREHGIDVGASAYIVKSNFDQSNLLEIVRRFL